MFKSILMDLAAVDTDGIFDGITGAGPWDSDDFNVGNPPDGLAHQLNFTSGDNLSAITATVVGTDADDNVISEDVALPNNTTVESTKYFKTVTDLSVDATLGANTLDVGWVDEAVSETIELDQGKASYWQLDVTGTLSIDTDWSLKPKNFDRKPHPWVDGSGVAAGLDAETADSTAVVAVAAGYSTMRFRLNSYSTGAEFTAYMTQPD
jgi:hypothetical protein